MVALPERAGDPVFENMASLSVGEPRIVTHRSPDWNRTSDLLISCNTYSSSEAVLMRRSTAELQGNERSNQSHTMFPPGET